ncbi:hypothetical protein D3C72_2110470 [compost metagenome]
MTKPMILAVMRSTPKHKTKVFIPRFLLRQQMKKILTQVRHLVAKKKDKRFIWNSMAAIFYVLRHLK